LALLSLLTNMQAENTNENYGAWSDAVGGLRGRLIVAHGKKFDGIDFLRVYLELQNVSDTLGELQIEGFDYSKSLKCSLLDALGNPPKQTAGAAVDVITPAYTMTLNVPWDSSLRVGVTAEGGYAPMMQKGGVFVGLFNGGWGVVQDDHADYFLEGTFHVDESVPHVVHNHIVRGWNGTLKLPKVKIFRD